MPKQIIQAPVKGYSIWLVPEERVQARLNSMIQEISTHFDSPTFDAHLTLLGQIEDDLESILPAFEQLGRSCSPLRLQTESIAYDEVYFRALYYKIGPSPQLLALNREARAIFKRKSEALFFPHISLLYSLSPGSAKRAALQQVQIPEFQNISISSMKLVRTEGAVQDWELIKRIDLQ